MLDVLKFVQGAVAKKDFVQALTHFEIKDGAIKGYNGSISLYSPIDLDIEATPKAVPFIKAIQTCKDETTQLAKTPTGRLSIKSGAFRAYIECTGDPFPDVGPEGTEMPLKGSFLDAIKVLVPFIAEDASRPWARGILFRGKSAYATNNVLLLQHWLDLEFPVEVNIPRMAILELIRIGEPPVAMRVADTSVTFMYGSGRWLRTQVHSTQWPDVDQILERPSNLAVPPAGFFEAAEDLKPFVNDLSQLFFIGDELATSLEDGVGARVQLGESLPKGIYNVEQLLKLKDLAKYIDFSQYPQATLFQGDNVRGAIIGMRS